MSKRLIVEPAAVRDNHAALAGDLARYVTRVLRLGVGDSLSLCDGAGSVFEGRIGSVTSGRVEVTINETHKVARPPGGRLQLLYGLAKATATETALQKATELGVERVTPVVCERSVARPRDGERKRARWTEIVRSAARQCERAFLPEIDAPVSFSAAIEQCSAPVKLIASVERGEPLRQHEAALRTASHITLAVGPEGGFSAAEVAAAERAGFAPISLGPTILRSETAAIAAIAIVSYVARPT